MISTTLYRLVAASDEAAVVLDETTLTEISNNTSDIVILLVCILFALGILIGSIFLKHFSFWKW